MKRASLFSAAALLAPACLAATVAGVEVPAPLPPKPVTETHFKVPVVDPYRYFEDVKDPAVQAWMKANADATTAILAKVPGREPLLARIQEIEASAPGITTDVIRVKGERFFFLKRDPADSVFRLVWRESAQGPDRTIVDPAELQKATGEPHAVMDFAPSPDGKRIAYSIQKGGGEIGTLHVLDLATGKELVQPIDRIRYASVSWLDDGSGFFYSRLREGYEKLPRPRSSATARGTSVRWPGPTPTRGCSAPCRTRTSGCPSTPTASWRRSQARNAQPTSWAWAWSATCCSTCPTSPPRRRGRRSGGRWSRSRTRSPR